jgi:predicted nucleotidyltransferase component of viral defense system
MPIFNKQVLEREAGKYGFQRDTFEKVVRLKRILEYINSTDFLNEHLWLKGGTAINLTVFDSPRLSVDIDMDYNPNDDKTTMKGNRQEIDKIIRDYMKSEGYMLSDDSRFSYSLDSYHYNYINSGGNRDLIKIELNYSLRAHIFDAVAVNVVPRIFEDGLSVKSLNPIEIFAAKANALLSRAAARDLYDFSNMIDKGLFERENSLFRKCIVFYASISAESINKSFNTSEIDKIDFAKIKRELFPVIEVKANFDLEGMKNKVKKYIADLMVLTPNEKEYLEKFEQKEYMPELLFEDKAILNRVKDHPMALWKCRE